MPPNETAEQLRVRQDQQSHGIEMLGDDAGIGLHGRAAGWAMHADWAGLVVNRTYGYASADDRVITIGNTKRHFDATGKIGEL
jgi:hypothetical protein